MAEPPASPKVWGDLDQAALDAAYDQTVYAPNFAQVIRRVTLHSRALRERLGEPQSHSYGPTPIETLYHYAARSADAPLHVHVHGGAWRQRSAIDMLFLAEPLLAADVGFAIFDFTAVEETGGRLEPMVEQVRRALIWLAQNARRLGADPQRLTVSGFSSGAHLASAALCADWRAAGLQATPFAAAFLASGMYDLYPVSLSKRSEYVAFTAETIEGLSPQRQLDRFTTPVIIAAGDCETPEFRRHARDFAAALETAGKPVRWLEAEGYNHYEVFESLGHPYSPLGRALLEQARQGAA